MRNHTRMLVLAGALMVIAAGLVAGGPITLAGQADHFEIFSHDGKVVFTRFSFPSGSSGIAPATSARGGS